MQLIDRKNQAVIYHSFASGFITCILGPRRVGKSTFVNKYSAANKEQTWVKLNMDSLAQRDQVNELALQQMIEQGAGQKLRAENKIWVLIDEAQKCPALFDQIKIIYDNYKDQNAIKFILTGSAALELHELASESLAGRIQLFHMYAFSLFESYALLQQQPLLQSSIFDLILSDRNDELPACINELSVHAPALKTALNNSLIWGSLPEVQQLQGTDDKKRYLEQYLQTYLEKDIRAISGIGNLKLYQQLLDVIAQQTGAIRQDNKVLEALSCSRDTLNKYRGYLSATLMYEELYPYIGSSLKRLSKSPKVYLQNNGLISYLTGVDSLQLLETTGMVGQRLENWFLQEIAIAKQRHVDRTQVYYWRTASGVEVDFIIEKKPNIYPFEITYSKTPAAKKIKNLQKFMQEYDAPCGFYVYMGDFKIDKEKNIIFLPAWAVA
jgi:hypothetical protein